MEYSLLFIGLVAIFTAVRWLFWRDYKVKNADHPMFLTHTPEGFPIGSVRDGYVVTRLEPKAPAALAAGGCVLRHSAKSTTGAGILFTLARH